MDKELDILIVEDVPGDADAIEAQLRQEGVRFRARRLETRDEFLAALKNSPPDIIISDFNLPAFDGLEALRLVQQFRPDIPFILVTGPRSEEIAVECMREGADDYILKDSLKRLPSAMHNALRKKAAERERARAEAALRRSEEQFRLITENTRDLVSLLDPEGRFLYANPSHKVALGYAPTQLVGTDSSALIHPDDRDAFQQTWQQALHHKDQRVAEARVRRTDGQWLTFESVGTWVFDEQGQPQRAVLISRDITRRKEAEEKLRSLPRLIVEAQETERRRVARELHDSVNQVLSSVKFRLESIDERLQKRDEGLWRECLKARFLLDKAIQEVIRISRNLRPSELDDLGLTPAVRSLCSEFTDRTGLRVSQAFDGVPDRCGKEIELALYRIIQEALTNIEKHARAAAVELRLSHSDAVLKASIRDDGAGFEPQSLPARKAGQGGMGLIDMQERAAHVGGVCTVISTPGRGTEILVTIPFNSEPRQRTREKKQPKTNPSLAGR
jgi:two-component system sensor histidine kinase UhpB